MLGLLHTLGAFNYLVNISGLLHGLHQWSTTWSTSVVYYMVYISGLLHDLHQWSTTWSTSVAYYMVYISGYYMVYISVSIKTAAINARDILLGSSWYKKLQYSSY